MSTILKRFTTRMPKKLLSSLSILSVPLYYVPGRGILFLVLQLNLHRSAKWRWLDIFDQYSSQFAWKHTHTEVYDCFKKEGLKDIECPNGLLSVKGRK